MWITTLNTETGQTASYPKHFLELFPNLVEVDEDGTCTDCVVQLDDTPAPVTPTTLVDLKEPTPPKRKKK